MKKEENIPTKVGDEEKKKDLQKKSIKVGPTPTKIFSRFEAHDFSTLFDIFNCMKI